MINVLHLGLSYKCNMRCKHCFVNKKNDRLKEEDYYKIIDTLYDQGLFVLYYTYGEPLLSKYFEKVSSYVKSKGINQILMTNGSLINEEKIEMLKRNNIGKVCISIDHSDSEKHDENRGYKNAFNKAINALNLLVKNDIHTEMSVTVNDHNALYLNEIYEMAKEMNVEFISCLRERNNGKIVEMKYENKYIDFFRSIILQNNVKVLFHDKNLIPTLYKLRDNNEISELIFERYYEMNCCHSKYTMSIAPNGDVFRCNLINNTIGNIFDKSLYNIIKNEGEKNEYTSCCSAIS